MTAPPTMPTRVTVTLTRCEESPYAQRYDPDVGLVPVWADGLDDATVEALSPLLDVDQHHCAWCDHAVGWYLDDDLRTRWVPVTLVQWPDGASVLMCDGCATPLEAPDDATRPAILEESP